jgi:hypothetical protein
MLLASLMFSASATAGTVYIQASQDNTLYEDPMGLLSNGAGEHLFTGLSGNQEKRRAVVAFRDLSAIPDGAVIQSVRLHLILSRENSDPTTVNLLRLNSDWGEGGSDAEGNEGGGAEAESGDATWIHRFWKEVTWNNPGGDFAEVASAQLEVDSVAAYTFGSTDAMENDLRDWLDQPEVNFGWILIADEDANTSKRFDSRENSDAANRPLLEVSFTTTGSPFDFSGIWWDSTKDGEGYNVYKTPFGWLIYFFGYSAAGEFLWITSDLVQLDELIFGQAIEFPMLIGVPGSFENPSPSAQLQPYGSLTVIFSGCDEGVFTLDGLDGVKVSNVIKLAGVEDTTCLEVR